MKPYITALRHPADHSPLVQASQVRVGSVCKPNRVVDIRRRRIHNIQVERLNLRVDLAQCQIRLLRVGDEVGSVFRLLETISQGDYESVRGVLPAFGVLFTVLR